MTETSATAEEIAASIEEVNSSMENLAAKAADGSSNAEKIKRRAEKVKENIGLSNLRRQLELLYKEYNLSVQQGESEFIALLKINLASHV